MSSKIENIFSFPIIFLIIFSFLIFLIFPLETFSDGTEFTIAEFFLGIAHPPSYPVHVMLSSITKYIPFGSLPFRANLFTAFFASVFLAFIYIKLEGSFYHKLLILFLILFSKTFLINSINGEVYILNVFLIFLIFFLLDAKGIKFFYLTGFLLGIGMGVHHTIIFIVIYMFFYFLILNRRVEVKQFSLFLFFVILGFSAYLYLPIRALKNPLWNWGNPRNLFLFLNSFFRYDFASEGLLRDYKTFLEQFLTFNPFYEFGLLNGFLLIFGLFFLGIKDRNEFFKYFFIILVFVFGVLVLIGNDTLTFQERLETYSVFFLPAYVSMVLAFDKLLKKFKFRKVLYVLIITGFVLNFGFNLKKELTYEKGIFPHDYGRMNLSMLPYGSVLIVVGGEKDFPILYQQKVCKFREDVLVVPLIFLGKFWNIKESLSLGSAYKPFKENENDIFNVIRSVILYQKEVVNKRVFTNVYDEKKLPKLEWQYNGIFKELGKNDKVDIDYFLRTRGKGGDDGFIENFINYKGESI